MQKDTATAIFRTLKFPAAKEALAGGVNICYEVHLKLGRGDGWSQGALMTAETYKACVKEGSFIDYDGYGDMLDADGKDLGRTRPSAIKRFKAECVYVLWYNR